MRLIKSNKYIIKYIRRLNYKYQKRKIKKTNCTIISNDCWGAEVYRKFNLEYNTPFVGLMVMAPCYLEILKDMPRYLHSPVQFIEKSKYAYVNDLRSTTNNYYPIGVLNDNVEIHFLHYHSVQEAEEKWKRRVSRINWNNLFVKFDCSKDLCTESILEEFDRLQYQKICFGKYKNEKIKSLIYIPDWNIDGKAMYKISLKHFDLTNWLNGGNGIPGFSYKLLYRILSEDDTQV